MSRESLTIMRNLLLAGGVLAACSAEARAQTQGLFGGQSLGGNSRMTGSMFGGSSRGQGGGSLMNSSVTGAGFLQTTQIGQMPTFLNQGFLGGGNVGNGGFIGRQSQSAQGNSQNRQFRTQGAARNRRGENDRNNNGNDNGQAGNRTNAARSRMVLRPRHEVAFEYNRPVASSLRVSLGERFHDFSQRRPELKGVVVAYDDATGELVLQGAVGSAGASKLAEALLRLEPGVHAVRNELTLASSADSESTSPGNRP